MNIDTEIEEVEAPQGFDDPCLERLTEAGLDKETDWNENSHKSLSKHQLEQKIKSYKKTFPGMTEKEIKERLHIEESHPDDPAEESEEEGEEYDDDSSFDDSDEEGDSESEDTGSKEEESEGIQESFLNSGMAHAAGATALVVAAVAGIGKFASYLENKFGLGSESYVKMLESRLKAWKQELGEVDDYYAQEKRYLARDHEDEMRELTEEYKRERRYYTDFIEDAQEHLNKAKAAYEAKKHKKQESVGSSMAKHAGDVAKTVTGGATAGIIVTKAKGEKLPGIVGEEAGKKRKSESEEDRKRHLEYVDSIKARPTLEWAERHLANVEKDQGKYAHMYPEGSPFRSEYDRAVALVRKLKSEQKRESSELPPISMIDAYREQLRESEDRDRKDYERVHEWGARSSALSGAIHNMVATKGSLAQKISSGIGGGAVGYALPKIGASVGHAFGGKTGSHVGQLIAANHPSLRIANAAGMAAGAAKNKIDRDKRKKEAIDMNRFGVNSAQGDNEPIRESLASQRAGQLPSHLTASNFPAGSFSLHPQAAIPVSDDPMSLMWAQFNQHRAHAARGL